MLAHVLPRPFAIGFILTLLVSAALLLVLAPSTGLAQGPVNSDGVPPDQRGWIPLTGGDEPHDRGRSVPSRAVPSQNAEKPGGQVPPAVTAASNQPADVNQGASSQSSVQDLGDAMSPSAPGTYMSPLVIPAADFRKDGNNTSGYFFQFNSGGAGGYVKPTTGIVCMMAPAHLPDNASVYQFWASFYDNGGAIRPWLYLYRVNNFDSALTSQVMATLTTSSTGTAIQNLDDLTISYPDVVYPDFSYYVGGCMYDNNQRFYSVRIWYTGP